MTATERTLRKRYQRAIAKHRRTATAASWFTLATILFEAHELSPKVGEELADGLGDPITCLRRCVRLAPNHKHAWHRLVEAYQAANDRDNAMHALKRIVKLEPRNAQAWNMLAILTLPAPGDDDAKLLRRAERTFRAAIDVDPRGKQLGWEPYAWLAEIAERMRDDPGALAWYREASSRGDRYAAARKQVIEDHGARRRPKRSSSAAKR